MTINHHFLPEHNCTNAIIYQRPVSGHHLFMTDKLGVIFAAVNIKSV